MIKNNGINKDSIPWRNKSLLEIKINDFYFLVNTFCSNGLKLVNQQQFKVFKAVNGKTSILELSTNLNFPVNDVLSFLTSLETLNMISITNSFNEQKFKLSSTKKLNLWVHTTNKCNLGCYYCNIATLQTTGAMPSIVKSQLTDKLYETAVKKQLTSIKLRLSGGEPLLQFDNWKDFYLITKSKLKEVNCEFKVAFLTNLTFLTDEIIAFAKKHKIGFGVSLDGFSEHHDFTRKFHNGKGSFSIVDKNLRKLISEGIQPSISTVISNENMEGLPLLTDYLIDLNLHFRYSIVHGKNLDRKKLTQILLNCYDIMENAIHEKNFSFSSKHKLCDLKPTELSHHTCSSAFSSAAIYVDGGVYFCHVKFGSKDKSGTIFDQEDIVTTIEKGKYNLGEFSADCNRCQYKFVCTSGCPMYRENGKDLSCDLYHKILPRYYELLGIDRLNKIKRVTKHNSQQKYLQ